MSISQHERRAAAAHAIGSGVVSAFAEHAEVDAGRFWGGYLEGPVQERDRHAFVGVGELRKSRPALLRMQEAPQWKFLPVHDVGHSIMGGRGG